MSNHGDVIGPSHVVVSIAVSEVCRPHTAAVEEQVVLSTQGEVLKYYQHPKEEKRSLLYLILDQKKKAVEFE